MAKYIDRETIQAIAQELHQLQKQDATEKSNQSASARANNNAHNMQLTPQQKSKKTGADNSTDKPKNIANTALLLFWGVVFVILLLKLAPYI